MGDIKTTILGAVKSMPSHSKYLKDFCPAR